MTPDTEPLLPSVNVSSPPVPVRFAKFVNMYVSTLPLSAPLIDQLDPPASACCPSPGPPSPMKSLIPVKLPTVVPPLTSPAPRSTVAAVSTPEISSVSVPAPPPPSIVPDTAPNVRKPLLTILNVSFPVPPVRFATLIKVKILLPSLYVPLSATFPLIVHVFAVFVPVSVSLAFPVPMTSSMLSNDVRSVALVLLKPFAPDPDSVTLIGPARPE